MSANKPWERPWSMDEIIANSDNWNLGGDVALLNTLKAFADNLLTKTTEINTNLQNLTHNLNETSLRLNIAQNEFQSLRNTQFIESRVYEDDESLVQVEEKKIEVESEDHSEDIRLAAVKGLEVLEEYFEKVELSVSDSEDETDAPKYLVLRPKDLYIERPLPYVIGSEEWHKNWHVGLEDSSSDSETEKVSDKFSESDSESDLPIIQDRSQIKGTSDTSSELDFSQKNEKSRNYSSDSENSAQVPVSSRNFAEELAAKLGHVITQEPEINRRPIQPKKTYGDVFFDEPPPLDEPQGLFSGGGGLFDDDDIPSPKHSKIASKGLFDEDDSDEEKAQVRAPLFSEEPPALEEKKKPIGGVSIFGGGNLFDKKLLRRQASSDEEEEVKKADLFEEKKVDLFSDDLFASSPKTSERVKKVNLFDSDEEEKGLFSDKPENKTEIFQKKAPEAKEDKSDREEKKISLFDDDLFKDDLFSSNSSKKFTSGLFDDIPEDDLFAETSKPNLFENLTVSDKNSINGDTSPPKTEPPPQTQPRISLFDSPPPEPDDLFANSPPKSDFFEKNIPTVGLFDPSPPPDDHWDTKSEHLSEEDFDFEETGSKTSLFSEEPPSLDPKPETGKIKPGKLKHNLNINVGALLPGSAPPRRDAGKNDVKRTSDVIKTSSEVVKTSFGAGPRSLPSDVPGASFDEADRVEVLHSVTKDRARVPLNRRPSTRRGRKEALRHSVPDFKLENEEIKSEEVKSGPKSLFEPPGEDLFGFEKNEARNEPKKEESSIFETSQSDDLFGFSQESAEIKKKETLFESSGEDLFGFGKEESQQKEKLFETPKKQSQSKGLFDDDDEDDLFSKKTVQPTAKLKTSLFDDDDDDEDIFKDFASANVKRVYTKLATEKKIPKVSSVKKLENTKPDDDPLSALLK